MTVADFLDWHRIPAPTGFMIKDLEMLIGPARPSLTMQPFLDMPRENLQDHIGLVT